MFMIVPQWEVFAELRGEDNRSMASYVKLRVSEGDLEGIIRTLRSNGYAKISMEMNRMPHENIAQTVED